MNKRLLITLLMLAVLSAPESSTAQRDRPEPEETPLDVAVSRFPTLFPDTVQVEVMTRIPLDDLVFLTYGDAFKTSYEISIFILDEDEMAQASRIWQEEVVEAQYRDTQSDELHHITQTVFTLTPGKYHVVVNLVDQDNRQRYKKRSEVEIEQFPGNQLVISDVLLLSERPGTTGGQDLIKPYFGNDVSTGVDTVYVYFVARRPTGSSAQATLSYSLEGKDKKPVLSSRWSLNLHEALTTHVVALSTEQIKAREYTLKLHLETDSLEAEQSVSIHMSWAGFTNMIEDLDLAIEQTRYVARRSQMVEMRDATGDAKQEAFLEFWRERDPTPDTPENEIMDEYYRRVAYANLHFRSFQPGWETDLGMVYVLYGPPDDIERHPFDMNQKPYQIWYYYDKGWRFVFVDVNMFGDYRLISPLYPSRSF